MWITILVMAIAVSLEPFRIGMTVLMLNRPRPMLQLLAFLSGGFAMGTTVGLVVLFALRAGLLESAHFTLPKVQIVIGVLGPARLAPWWPTDGRGRFGAGLPGGEDSQDGRRRGSGTAQVARCGSRRWRASGSRCRPSTTWRRWLVIRRFRRRGDRRRSARCWRSTSSAFALGGDSAGRLSGGAGRTRASMTALNDWIRSRRRRGVAALCWPGSVCCFGDRGL